MSLTPVYFFPHSIVIPNSPQPFFNPFVLDESSAIQSLQNQNLVLWKNNENDLFITVKLGPQVYASQKVLVTNSGYGPKYSVLMLAQHAWYSDSPEALCAFLSNNLTNMRNQAEQNLKAFYSCKYFTSTNTTSPWMFRAEQNLMNINFFLDYQHEQREIRLNVDGHFLMDDEIFTDINALITKAQELEVEAEPIYDENIHTLEDAVISLRDNRVILWYDFREKVLFLMQIEDNRLLCSKIVPTADGYMEYEKQNGMWQLTCSELFVSNLLPVSEIE